MNNIGRHKMTKQMRKPIIKIIQSGGQTGVDRAALDAAIESGIEIRGWCPKGGWAEDMSTPPGLMSKYPVMEETPSEDLLQRTAWNVRDTDILIVLSYEDGISPGTEATIGYADYYGKPFIIVNFNDDKYTPENVYEWICGVFDDMISHDNDEDNLEEINGLSIDFAGPRESESPGTYEKSKKFISELIAFDR